MNHHKHPFEVRCEDGKFVIVSDHDEEFYMTASDSHDASYACSMLNKGFSMGFDDGVLRSQTAVRQAIGLD